MKIILLYVVHDTQETVRTSNTCTVQCAYALSISLELFLSLKAWFTVNFKLLYSLKTLIDKNECKIISKLRRSQSWYFGHVQNDLKLKET